MVFESLLNPKLAEKKPYLTFLHGVLISTVSLFLAYYVMPANVSLTMVFFITMVFIPLFYRTMIYEEKKDILTTGSEQFLLREHSKAAYFFLFLFLGTTLALSFWFVVFDQTGMLNEGRVFHTQLETIAEINGRATEDITGNAISNFSLFTRIFSNNIKVMIFCILFSFIFGTGAIFILTWNSTVIAAALGSYITKILAVGSGTGLALLTASSCGLLRYMVHGIPEIAGYFFAGLGGGIISAAMINHDFGSKNMERIILDASTLIIIAILILFFAGLVEVGVTPLLICK